MAVDTALVHAWQEQVRWCDELGSPFTARLLQALLAQWKAGGVLRDALPAWRGDPRKDAVPLRVAGALHAMALGGDAELATLFPPQVSNFDTARGPDVLRAAIERHAPLLREYLASPPQTNEIGRSAALLGGFAIIAKATRGLPLCTLEIGASAGLNQLWHRFGYELYTGDGGGLRWGEPDAAVRVRSEWRGHGPALPAHFDVRESAACDMAPIDLNQNGAAERLMSYVWADQAERLERLRAAITLARQRQIQVDTASADEWIEAKLARPRPGCVTVLYHSLVWQYLGEAAQQRIQAAMNKAALRANAGAPLAWLRFEPDAQGAIRLLLRLWPGGTTTLLADAHAHGRHVVWRPEVAAPDVDIRGGAKA